MDIVCRTNPVGNHEHMVELSVPGTYVTETGKVLRGGYSVYAPLMMLTGNTEYLCFAYETDEFRREHKKEIRKNLRGLKSAIRSR